MRLIKCGRCGRPYYDSESTCPYCGQDTRLSLSNLVTKPISDPKAHQYMVDVLSGNIKAEKPATIAANVVAEPATPPAAATAIDTTPMPEPETAHVPAEEPVVELSEAVQERAQAMASLDVQTPETPYSNDIAEIDDIETADQPRKRRGWLWIVLILLLALAAVAYWQRDTIMGMFK